MNIAKQTLSKESFVLLRERIQQSSGKKFNIKDLCSKNQSNPILKETDSNGTKMEKVNIYGEEFTKCQEKVKEFENSDVGMYYKENLCLKVPKGVRYSPTRSTLIKDYEKIAPYITNSFDEVCSHHYKKLCILPKGHSGPCSCSMKLFVKNKITEKLKESIDKSIFTTPGDNDHVYKNRSPRSHPIAISSKDEKFIRSQWSGGVKEKKLKCAIPLKEQSTPFLQATAYLDWITYTMNVTDIQPYIDKESPHYLICKDLLSLHKQYLQTHFSKYNRKIFNDQENTICAVKRDTIKVNDLADPNRDNRVDIRDSDIQLGHITSRCDECYTIYGTNILMMSRRGNLLIGEHSFIEEDWLNELKTIVQVHSR